MVARTPSTMTNEGTCTRSVTDFGQLLSSIRPHLGHLTRTRKGL